MKIERFRLKVGDKEIGNLKELMSDEDFEMSGTREDAIEEFEYLIEACEKSISSLGIHWHRQMMPILEGGKYEEINTGVWDTIIRLRSDVMLLDCNARDLKELHRNNH